MRKFIYKVPISKADIIDAINTPNLADELQCSINFEKSTIAFSSYDVMQGEYYFDIQEHDGFSILRLESVTSILFKNELACKINPFIIRKLNAQAIPYTQYNSYPL